VLKQHEKGHAFVEFADEVGAEKIINLSNMYTLQLNGKPLQIKWSGRQSITSSQSGSVAVNVSKLKREE